MKTLILERGEISEAIDMKKCIDLCEMAFALTSEGKINYPPRIWLNHTHASSITPPIGGFLGTAFVNEPGYLALKLLTKGIQVIFLFDYTKNIFVLMDGSIITDLRTAAGAAVSVRHIAQKNSSHIGILGSGNVARHTLWALCEELPIEVVKVYSHTRENREKYAKEMSQKLQLEVLAKSSAIKAVKDAQVIITATTANEKILLDEYVPDGAHICALGNPEEIDPRIFLRAKVFTELLEQSKREGKLSNAIKTGIIDEFTNFPELGDVILGLEKGRTTKEEVTLFDSQGLIAQDAVVAWEVYSKLYKEGKGKIMNLDIVGGLPFGIPRISARAKRKIGL